MLFTDPRGRAGFRPDSVRESKCDVGWLLAESEYLRRKAFLKGASKGAASPGLGVEEGQLKSRISAHEVSKARLKGQPCWQGNAAL